MEICGTAAANTTVTVYDGETSLGTANSDGNGDWCFDRTSNPLAAGQHSITATAKYAGSNPSTLSDLNTITCQNAINAYKDTETKHLGVTSLRLEKTGSYDLKIAVNTAALVTVKAYVRYNSEYGSAEKPKITLSGLGISGTETGQNAVATVAALNGWEQLTVSGTPGAEEGVVTLTVETFSTAAGAKAWVDDISVSQ